MASRRPLFLDGTNAALLAAILAAPALALVLWLGPLRGFVHRAGEEQALQRAEIERLIERKRALTSLAPSERERVDHALTAFEADLTPLGADPNTTLVQSISSLLEAASASDVRVTLAPPIPGEETRAALVVGSLDGARPMTLVPNAVHVTLRSDFAGLRAALDALRDPGRTIQIERANFARDGAGVKAALELVYWSREREP
jgi:hypothetical protein